VSLASLPMYDRPETRGALDRLWQGVRARLGEGPAHLTREGDPWDHWRAPDLVLSQTCGYPFRARLHDRVTLVGAADHRLEGCPPGHYRSALVARANDPRERPADFAGARLAYNEALSQSGWAAAQNLARAQGFAFGPALRTGAHANSARAVAEGRADIAALDAVTWRLIARHDPMAGALRVVGHTPPTPALPFITASGRDPGLIFDALSGAIAALAPADREELSLFGLVRVSAAAYLAVPNPPPPDA